MGKKKKPTTNKNNNQFSKDPIVGTWGAPLQGSERFAWNTANGQVSDGLIKALPENSEEIWRQTANARNKKGIEKVLRRIPTYELYIDENKNYIADGGDTLAARGYSTFDGFLNGGDSGVFRGGKAGVGVFDSTGLMVGQLQIISSVF